jgi:hypothetical protein
MSFWTNSMPCGTTTTSLLVIVHGAISPNSMTFKTHGTTSNAFNCEITPYTWISGNYDLQDYDTTLWLVGQRLTLGFEELYLTLGSNNNRMPWTICYTKTSWSIKLWLTGLRQNTMTGGTTPYTLPCMIFETSGEFTTMGLLKLWLVKQLQKCSTCEDTSKNMTC